MFLLSWKFADGVTLKLGDQVWSFGLNVIAYLIVAAIVGFVAEALVGWRLLLGFVGASIAALLGAWLLTKVVVIQALETSPSTGCACSAPCSARSCWSLSGISLTSRAWRGRQRSSSSRN